MSQLVLASNSVAISTAALGHNWTTLAGFAAAHIVVVGLCWAAHKAYTAARQSRSTPAPLRQPLYEGFALRE